MVAYWGKGKSCSPVLLYVLFQIILTKRSKFDFSMKNTFKCIAANVVTVKFTLACKCHVLAVFVSKNAKFWKKTDLPKNPYRFWQGVFCFKFLTFITFQAISKCKGSSASFGIPI